MTHQVISVTQISEYIRSMLDNDRLLSNVAVRGEISNYKIYPSGHHYFTVKDEDAALKCVMFRGNTMRLRFRPENGMQVVAVGKISVYPRDGAYQLYCVSLVPDGVGDLYAAFEQLKNRLSAQGLFDQSYKKPLPAYPQTIGIITSQAGAAVHDMLRILNKRYPICRVRLLPVRVQGAEAPAEISAAIRYANAHDLADLLIVGRGGGSMEDLWAFNDEMVAHAIYESRIPVISAVGHEPDVTISDFVADVRAATPSNAAELAVPDREALLQQLDSMLVSMETALQRRLKALEQQLRMLAASPALQSPYGYISQRKRELELLCSGLTAAQCRTIDRQHQRFLYSAGKLDAISPLKVLTRGYALLESEQKEVLRSVQNIPVGSRINITMCDGALTATVNEVKRCDNEQEEPDL